MSGQPGGCATTFSCWPAVVAYSIDHSIGISAKYPTASSTTDIWTEIDLFENMIALPQLFFLNVHTWSNNYRYDPLNSGATNLMSQFASFDSFAKNRYGYLWIPATPQTSGTFNAYINDVSFSNNSYAYVDCNNPPTDPKAIGFIDCLHSRFDIVTGPNQPLKIYSFKIWQKRAMGNINSASPPLAWGSRPQS